MPGNNGLKVLMRSIPLLYQCERHDHLPQKREFPRIWSLLERARFWLGQEVEGTFRAHEVEDLGVFAYPWMRIPADTVAGPGVGVGDCVWSGYVLGWFGNECSDVMDDWRTLHFSWWLRSAGCQASWNLSCMLFKEGVFISGAAVLSRRSFKIAIPLSCIS